LPTINVLFNDLQRLVGVPLPQNIQDLNDLLSSVKGEVESNEGGDLSIEIKDGNRPDLWNVEGIARELRGALGIEEGLKEYTIEAPSGVEIFVDARLWDIRPYIACSIITKVQLSSVVLRELMRLQEKLDLTYGRKRTRTSIGLYNYDLLTSPIRYSVASPQEISFVPLGDDKELSLEDILTTHPKGLEYGYILSEKKQWPILLDAKDKILSFPPIINSNDLGRVTEGVRDLFVEVTGTGYKTVLNTLMIVTLSLADRGEKILSTRIRYPYDDLTQDETPNLKTNTMQLNVNYVNQILGLDLNVETIIHLLKKARYNAYQTNRDTITLTIPCYRIDVMHPIDVIEDIAIKYGYNNIDPQWPQLTTLGRTSDLNTMSNRARDVMVGLGFQEVLSFSMSNKSNLLKKMHLKDRSVVEISNPMTINFDCLRDWLTPSLLEFLSKNASVEHPQRVFEVGKRYLLDKTKPTGVREETGLACVCVHSKANFNEIKAVLDAFFSNMGVMYTLVEGVFDYFINGRAGAIFVDQVNVGFIGEFTPIILEMWNLENPVIGFEIDLDSAFGT
jgi:phenylalanyl-tRNA synthetase beta chain